MSEATEFCDALAAALPEQERMIVCGFGGDPNRADPTAWRPFPWRPGHELDLGARWNAYVTVASFGRAADGTFRRRGETFAAGRALMVDDVGTKVDPAIVSILPPTARVETSPGNEQWWYMLDEPCRDAARFDGVIRAFIAGKLLGSDPGMSGVTRVGRIPGYFNCKEKYAPGFRVKLLELSGQRYSIEALLKGFGLTIHGRRVGSAKLHSEEAVERNRAFMSAYKFLDQRGMLKRDQPDPSGWVEMSCPFIDSHTAGADTGAALREPAPENDYYGGFRCHHGHCIDRGWRDLTDWINEQAAEELDAAAREGV